jgi:hypothetical protein
VEKLITYLLMLTLVRCSSDRLAPKDYIAYFRKEDSGFTQRIEKDSFIYVLTIMPPVFEIYKEYRSELTNTVLSDKLGDYFGASNFYLNIRAVNDGSATPKQVVTNSAFSFDKMGVDLDNNPEMTLSASGWAANGNLLVDEPIVSTTLGKNYIYSAKVGLFDSLCRGVILKEPFVISIYNESLASDSLHFQFDLSNATIPQLKL